MDTPQTELDSSTAIDLTRVAGNDPAAVLLVDLKSRTIVYANGVARQMAPGVNLPAELDAWSDAAHLMDLEGVELADSAHPLSLIARAVPVAGQAVSAARPTALGSERQPMWAVAVPIDAPQLEDHGLVVFLSISPSHAQGELRDKAVLATGMSFTMADAQAPDMPLVWVNPAFTLTTGYSLSEVVGRNCRFLQGKDTDPRAHVQMREALDAGESATVTLLNYRKDGAAFWNEVAMSPILDAAGSVTHYVGIQTDVTERVLIERERERALTAEREARMIAQQAQAQLSLLAEATSQLAATQEEQAALEILVQLVVPTLADCALAITAGEGTGSVEHIAVLDRNGRSDLVERYKKGLSNGFVPGSFITKIFQGHSAVRFDNYSSDQMKAQRNQWVDNPDVLSVTDELDPTSVIIAPMTGRSLVNGVLVLIRTGDSKPYTERDQTVTEDLGRRAGLILDNTRLYQSEHRIAETLQRSLLPDLPRGLNAIAAARYRASQSGAAVGGDFYEVIALQDGAIGVAIGDVVGHDVLAAAAMGHLRGLLRACAWESPGSDARRDPSEVLTHVDQLIQGLEISTLASVAYARIEPTDNGWKLHYSSAGHPPMMVRNADRTVTMLDESFDVMLGVGDAERTSNHYDLAPGSLLLAYTDGLVERRDKALNSGFDRLAERLSEGPDQPEELCDDLLDYFSKLEDDVAILAVQL